MWSIIEIYWPHVLAALSVTLATLAAIHATMTKTEVRAALGWVGVILLSPLVGALIYLAFGINRIRRRPLRPLAPPSASPPAPIAAPAPPEAPAPPAAPADWTRVVTERFGRRMGALHRLGSQVSGAEISPGNHIEVLGSGDATYGAMLEAIHNARRSILLETYIFDNDRLGRRIVEALALAQSRGVAVRVLIDAVGVRYSTPTILRPLADEGLPAALFNGRLIIGLRLPYANLRTHRKILVVDGDLALVGGMNIRAGFSQEFAGNTSAHDTHFRVTGPAVAEYLAIAAEDWGFATQERLEGPVWAPSPRPPAPEPPFAALSPRAATAAAAPMLLRVVASGPDARLETAHKLLMGAFSVARQRIRILSPYFLPDRELISALTTAARRGVEIDIVTPQENNLTLVDHAMRAQFDQVLKDGCRVWRAQGPFDHSKLLTIDDCWSFVGSSNLDPRSLRLNFEIDTEVYDHHFAHQIAARIDEALRGAHQVTLEELRARPFLQRLVDRALWLGSPYL